MPVEPQLYVCPLQQWESWTALAFLEKIPQKLANYSSWRNKTPLCIPSEPIKLILPAGTTTYLVTLEKLCQLQSSKYGYIISLINCYTRGACKKCCLRHHSEKIHATLYMQSIRLMKGRFHVVLEINIPYQMKIQGHIIASFFLFFYNFIIGKLYFMEKKCTHKVY